MANFPLAFNYVIGNEDPHRTGKVVAEPFGGYAKYGINSIAHPDVDVEKLTLAEAQDLYEQWYWNPIHGNQIKSQPVANKLLDIAFWHGIARAGVWVQRALINMSGATVIIAVDGIIGPKTIRAINKAKESLLLVELSQANVDFINSRAQASPEIAKIKDSLLARAEKQG